MSSNMVSRLASPGMISPEEENEKPRRTQSYRMVSSQAFAYHILKCATHARIIIFGKETKEQKNKRTQHAETGKNQKGNHQQKENEIH